ncbi:hypothetical protein BSL78_02096 [Apostichopus japonicus]|uniref:Uncharacterized protein n=1 Tax=Stichopus japonicus TaxID=307972 RepID=A0A2G8LL40_STIJA|nr:hypothetical protein BSL78_02096 [Apostichopus japonicus]
MVALRLDGLSTVGVYDLLKADGHFFTGIFLLSVGVIVLLLETISVLALTCCRKITCCHKYTKVVGWFDTWKRGLVYAIVGAICFLAILRTKYSIVCGISMILAGSLYILKACKVRSVKRSAETDRKALTQDFHDGQKLDV